jgi:hypothetical protein
MSMIQARLRTRFANWLHGLSGTEKDGMDALLADIRMMNNKSKHQGLGDARLYSRAGVWVRDLPFLAGINIGANRLIYSQVSKDAHEVQRGFPGHVEVYGIGDPHDSSGFKQVNTFADIKWHIY